MTQNTIHHIVFVISKKGPKCDETNNAWMWFAISDFQPEIVVEDSPRAKKVWAAVIASGRVNVDTPKGNHPMMAVLKSRHDLDVLKAEIGFDAHKLARLCDFATTGK